MVVLAIIALMGIGLAAVGPQWAQDARRDEEAQLLRVGALYARALRSYYMASPGSVKQYPARLEDLLLDPRLVGTHRYIRKLYADPTEPSRGWGLIRADDGGIRGVHSLSDAQPYLRAAVELDGFTRLPAASRYSEWRFISEAQP